MDAATLTVVGEPGAAKTYTYETHPDSPHARFRAVGPQGVTTSELIALVLGNREPGDTERTLAAGGLMKLRESSVEVIADHKGLGMSKSIRLLAAIEMGRRTLLEESPKRPRLDSPELAWEYLHPRYSGNPSEAFGLLALDSKHRLLGEKIVANGGRHSVAISPADVFQAALPFRPRSIIVFHNHPSGDPHPSEEDKALTYRLARSGEVLGIACVDHVVLGASSFASFKQLGLL